MIEKIQFQTGIVVECFYIGICHKISLEYLEIDRNVFGDRASTLGLNLSYFYLYQDIAWRLVIIYPVTIFLCVASIYNISDFNQCLMLPLHKKDICFSDTT